MNDNLFHTHNGLDSRLIDKQANSLLEVTRGIVAPVNMPKQIGDIYINTATNKVYIATSLAVVGWQILN